MPDAQCIFCQICAGAVASKKVYEDEKVVAVLDINPANPGHVLLMPREHYPFMPQVPDDVVAHMGMIAKQLSQAMLRGIKASGTNVFVANGGAAGQRALHAIMHVIPRAERDGVTGLEVPEGRQAPEALLEMRTKLAPFINNALGYEIPAQKPAMPAQARLNLDEIADFLGGRNG